MHPKTTVFVWAVVGFVGQMAMASPPATARVAQPENPSRDPSQNPTGDPTPRNREVQKPARPGLLLVVEEQMPTISVSWTSKGQKLHATETVSFTAPVGGSRLGRGNVLAYAALGGTRLETGAGHPRGALIRLGITKNDSSRAFFAGIDPGTDIEMTIRGVRFNQPVKYNGGTAMMHLKYALGDLKACALPGTARNQYLLSDPHDTLGGRVQAGINATPGALDGGEGHGEVSVEVQDDDPTLVNMRVRVPYALLRHLQDPWKSELPGTFFEPIHMHTEAEVIPIGAEPLHRDHFVPEKNETTGDRKAPQLEPSAPDPADPAKPDKLGDD